MPATPWGKSGRRAAARALGRFGPAAKGAEAALIEPLRDAEDQVRRSAAGALGKIRERRVADGVGLADEVPRAN
jgi:HEAT repeat protein